MTIPNISVRITRRSGSSLIRRGHFHGRKQYYAGRWFVRGDVHRWSAPAYVSPGNRQRVSMRGPIYLHS